MKWTTETPTQPGYYWLRVDKRDDDPSVVRVTSLDSGQVIVEEPGNDSLILINLIDGEWCGPIAAPLDAGEASPKAMEVEDAR